MHPACSPTTNLTNQAPKISLTIISNLNLTPPICLIAISQINKRQQISQMPLSKLRLLSKLKIYSQINLKKRKKLIHFHLAIIQTIFFKIKMIRNLRTQFHYLEWILINLSKIIMKNPKMYRLKINLPSYPLVFSTIIPNKKPIFLEILDNQKINLIFLYKTKTRNLFQPQIFSIIKMKRKNKLLQTYSEIKTIKTLNNLVCLVCLIKKKMNNLLKLTEIFLINKI